MLAAAILAFSEGGESIVQPNASLVVVFVLFLLFVFVLNRVMFKPIGRVLDEREALTEGRSTEARAASRRYQSRLADYEEAIRKARGENYRRLEQERAAALDLRRRLIEDAKLRAAQEVERAKSEIAEQTARARLSLGAESRQIAERISRTVLGRTVGGGVD